MRSNTVQEVQARFQRLEVQQRSRSQDCTSYSYYPDQSKRCASPTPSRVRPHPARLDRRPPAAMAEPLSCSRRDRLLCTSKSMLRHATYNRPTPRRDLKTADAARGGLATERSVIQRNWKFDHNPNCNPDQKRSYDPMRPMFHRSPPS